MPPIFSQKTRPAFEALLRPCIGSLYGAAYRMCGERQAAEDLVHETCLKAYARFSQYQDGSNFKAWLFRIMTNAFIDLWRKDGRSPVFSADDSYLDAASANDVSCAANRNLDPEIHVLYRTFKSDALKAMAELPVKLRVVVALAFLEEFSYQEIAEVVDCPVGTVRSRLNRGREKLRIALRDYRPAERAAPGEVVSISPDDNRRK